MFLSALAVALLCACAAAHTPLSASADDNNCALYLSGPGRTSAYDYRLNLLRGNFNYEGQHTCITYEAVNQAYVEARKRILVSQPKGDWTAEDFASVGELVLDISINLAKTYGLTYEEIEKGLPLIDTSLTRIREVCPPVFSHVECRAGKYRRLDGLCNNLQQPTWGATMAPFQRLIGPLFSDGINAPRIAHSGRELPLSRVVSRTMHPDEGFHDHAGTVMVIAWGQFMDHDYTLTGTPLDPRNRNDPEECCKRPQHLKHPYCNEIRIPDDDYFYRLFGVKCIDFVRGFPSPRPGCRLGSRVPFNTLTGALDGNTVYGVTEKFARKLRTGYGGLLRMNPVFKEYGLKDLLPLKLDIPDEGCTRPNKNMYCFEAGEIRVNEQLVLTVMHTLMAREHNRVAKGLAAVNPHWDDETLYQEARRITVTEIQHITYNEFLPILLGKDVMEKFGLVLQKQGYWDGYDPNVNPDVIAGFASAAYRFGHSLLPTAVERWSKAHKFIASKRLSDLIRRPYDLYRAGVLDEYVMGLMNQVAQAMDDSITQEVTNHLFKKVGARFGMDLVSFNMQRGREFGIPGYMEYRKFCGLSGAETFQDLFGSMPNETVRKYESIFEHPVDVDLWSGGVSERPLPGSMLGPTFACVIATQFSYSRRGDRFWYELPNQPSSFTPEQLAEVRKARLARVICDNTDIIDTTQLYPMVLPDHELNPRVPCRSGIIPSIDFSKWAEPPPFAGPAKQFITVAQIQEQPETNQTFGEKKNRDSDVDSDAVSNGTDTPVLNTVNIEEIKEQPLNITNITDIGKNDTVENKTLVDADTILKYVYKENEKQEKEKTKGNVKNSLRRRKRATVDYLGPSNTPLIVNYETSHQPHHTHQPYQTHQAQIHDPTEGNPGKFIKKSNLAGFSLETLHDEIVHSNNRHHQEPSDNDDKNNLRTEETSSQQNSESNENNSDASREVNDDKSGYKKSEENVRKYDINNQSSGERSRPSNENNDDDDDNETDRRPNSSENVQSRETENDSPIQKQYNSEDISSKENYKNKKPSSDKDSNEGAETDSTSIENLKDKHRNNNEGDKKLPILIQDVDLDDFSYEKLKLNKNGHVEPINEEPENSNQASSVEKNSGENSEYKETPEIYAVEVKPVIEVGANSESTESKEELEENKVQKLSPNKGHTSEYSQKPNHDDKEIASNRDSVESNEKEEKKPREDNSEYREHPKNNVDEVKPVVEIGANSESTESDEEDSPNDDDENVEAFQDYIKTGINGKLNQKKENVKQEFERIPLNYNHDSNGNPKKTKEKEDAAEADDVPPASDGHYDDNLNFKFDDVTVQLPEVKLPEDVLAYNIKEPKNPNEPENESGEEEAEEEEESEKDKNENASESTEDSYEHDHDNYDFRSSPYKKELPKRKSYHRQQYNQNEDDVDLYEKFVAERFGKRDTFEKRSQKLQDLRFVPTNPDLYKQIGKILKKTEKTTREAAKSGDPNAGYAWTLEYGQKLV